jgi:uncharacterized protein
MANSFLEFAYDVLKQAPKPLTYQEVWTVGQEKGLEAKLNSSGKTPWQSIGAQLYVDVRDNDESKFVKIGKRPARFFLKERQGEVQADAIAKIEKEEAKKPEKKAAFHERDLHPLLTYFAYSNLPFNRGRAVHTKTIYHENSKKPGYNEWVYPDVVGFYIPVDEWDDAVIEINRLCDNNSLRLFSFELKKSVTKANYRESFFQAVSNSSWAHEGYLVASEVLQEDDFLAELQRLASSFGIGVIHLDLEDIDASKVIFPARQKNGLDWDTINKLCEQNADFKKFLKHVKIDFQAKTLHKSEYDEVLKDVPEYIKTKLMVTV